MNAASTTPGRRIDEHRRMLLLGAAGASLAQLSGCGVGVAVHMPLVASSVPLMFHCHILEHEDAGMMGQFIIA